MGILKFFKKRDKKKKAAQDEKKVGSFKISKKEKSEIALSDKKEKKVKTKKVQEIKKQEKIKKTKKGSGSAYKILIKPRQTEKATIQASENKYVFEVSKKANKNSIKQAIYDLYSIKPLKVQTMNQSSRAVRYGRIQGRTKPWKKAIVTLPKGKSIQIYEGV